MDSSACLPSPIGCFTPRTASTPPTCTTRSSISFAGTPAATLPAPALLKCSSTPAAARSPTARRSGGNYFGLYTVEEKIKRGENRVDIVKLEPQVTNAPAITGGYMLKIDRADSNERTFYDSYLQGSIVYVDPPGLEMVDASRAGAGQLHCAAISPSSAPRSGGPTTPTR